MGDAGVLVGDASGHRVVGITRLLGLARVLERVDDGGTRAGQLDERDRRVRIAVLELLRGERRTGVRRSVTRRVRPRHASRIDPPAQGRALARGDGVTEGDDDEVARRDLSTRDRTCSVVTAHVEAYGRPFTGLHLDGRPLAVIQVGDEIAVDRPEVSHDRSSTAGGERCAAVQRDLEPGVGADEDVVDRRPRQVGRLGETVAVGVGVVRRDRPVEPRFDLAAGRRSADDRTAWLRVRIVERRHGGRFTEGRPLRRLGDVHGARHARRNGERAAAGGEIGPQRGRDTTAQRAAVRRRDLDP